MELDDQTDAMQIGQVLARSTILPSKSATDSSGEVPRHIQKADLTGMSAVKDDEGRKPWEEQERKRADEGKSRRRNSVWKELIEARGPRYATATLDQFAATTPEQLKAKAAVADYVENIAANLKAGQNVLFIGPAGTGKPQPTQYPSCHTGMRRPNHGE